MTEEDVMPSPFRPQRDDIPPPLELTPEQRDRLHRTHLELLTELDRVCKAHDLTYFALYGTMLGAAREKGIIPWDDDLDVAMLRPDYDRLCEIVQDQLGEDYFFQNAHTDPHCGYLFGKLRKNGTRCVDRDSYGSQQHSGISIDIFPLDAKATGWFGNRAQRALRHIGFRLLYLKAGYLFLTGETLPTRVLGAIATTVARLLPRRFLIWLTELTTRVGRRPAPQQYVSLFGAYPYDWDTVDAAWILPTVELPFEDRTIPGMADSDAYLTQIYNKWRQPPPPGSQMGHHDIIELDFG